MKITSKHLSVSVLVSVLLALFPITGMSQTSAEQNAEIAVECISTHSSIYSAYNCVNEITQFCLENTGENSNDEMTCLDLEASAWNTVYSRSLDSLRDATSLRAVEGARAALEDTVQQFDQSYLRSCAFEVGRWPQNAALRNIDSFRCVRDGAFERAVAFFFWNKEILTLMGE